MQLSAHGICLIFISLLSLGLLNACSPHPGSGTWLNTDPQNELNKLVVHFESKAEFHNASNKTILHCGWWATSSDIISIQCVRPPNTEDKEDYQLNVNSDNQATLMMNNTLIGQFTRQPQ